MLSAFIYNRLLSIASLLREYAGSEDPEIIHMVRVEIKKTRAVFSFLKKLEGEKSYAKRILEHLFNVAGSLRELQLNIMLLESFDRPMALISELKAREKKEAAEFVNQIPAFLDEVRAQERSLILPAENIQIKKLRRYFDKLIDKCNDLLKNTEDADALHHFRQLLKKLMYVFEALSKRLQKLVGLNEKYANNLQKKAGDWHDAFVSWQFLQSPDSFPEDLTDKSKINERKKYHSMLKLSEDFEDKIYKD